MIKSADIPEVFKNLLLKNNNKEMYDELGVTTFPQYIGAYVARLVINIIAFILTFIVVTVIIRAVVFALDIVSELPVIGSSGRWCTWNRNCTYHCVDPVYDCDINVYDGCRKRNL